jgi:hypothetical protein
VPWLVEIHGCRIIADGDRKQMPPYEGDKPWCWFEESPYVAVVPLVELAGGEYKDWRSKTPDLAAFKLELRTKQSNSQVIEAIAARVGSSSYEAFLEEWHPRDYVYIAVHTMRELFHKDLAQVHRAKYPTEPTRVRYGESSKDKSGEEEWVPLGAEIPAHAELAYTTTYSSCQGETAGPDDSGRRPRVWLVDYRLQRYENAVYVGATRVEFEDQWGVISTVPLSDEEKTRVEYLYGEDDVR